MQRHTKYDTGTEINNNTMKLPDQVDHIEFGFDGGRVFIAVNGVELYRTYGSNDVRIEIGRK